MKLKIVFVIVLIGLLTAFKFVKQTSGGCSSCGCTAGHCGAGIPGHLSCSGASPYEKRLIDARKEAKDTAFSRGIREGAKDCNKLIQTIAAEYGHPEFKEKNLLADQMFETYFSSEAIKNKTPNDRCIINSYSPVTGKPKAINIDEAKQFCNAGQLCIGFLDSKVVNHVAKRDKVYVTKEDGTKEIFHTDNGHVFAIEKNATDNPDGTTDKSGKESPWKTTRIANAGTGTGKEKQAAIVYANRVISEWQRPYVCFIVLTK